MKEERKAKKNKEGKASRRECSI